MRRHVLCMVLTMCLPNLTVYDIGESDRKRKLNMDTVITVLINHAEGRVLARVFHYQI